MMPHDTIITAAQPPLPHPPRSEKDAKLAQQLGQLQPFTAVFPQEAWANWHILGQANTFLAPGRSG